MKTPSGMSYRILHYFNLRVGQKNCMIVTIKKVIVHA